MVGVRYGRHTRSPTTDHRPPIQGAELVAEAGNHGEKARTIRGLAVVHADESCLGNGRDGPNRGGAGALIEIRVAGQITRHDIYISAPDTTNNRMALAGAIATFALLSRKD